MKSGIFVIILGTLLSGLPAIILTLTQKSKLKLESMNHLWILISGRAAAIADVFKATSVILQMPSVFRTFPSLPDQIAPYLHNKIRDTFQQVLMNFIENKLKAGDN